MYYLHQLEMKQQIPRLPIYVDSPMAISVTQLYEIIARMRSPSFARKRQRERTTRSTSRGST